MQYKTTFRPREGRDTRSSRSYNDHSVLKGVAAGALGLAVLGAAGLGFINYVSSNAARNDPAVLSEDQCGIVFSTGAESTIYAKMEELYNDGRLRGPTFMDAIAFTQRPLYMRGDGGQWTVWDRQNHFPGDEFCVPKKYTR